MQVVVRNASGTLRNDDRDYAVKKLSRLDRFFHSAKSIEIVYHEEKMHHRVDVTIHADGYHLRGAEEQATVRSAIDIVAEKLENRLRRLKTRIVKSHRNRGRAVPPGLEEAPAVEEDEHGINEQKTYLLKPMSLEEAALQMELLGRNFFVFLNEGSGQTEVLYRRDSGPGYGLIVPEGSI
jgi:putative sigma-54 modulation protein